ncbi:acyl-CoA dehydrogenase family protein [Nocardioides sp. AE5]|uniref:acyl-CoA dehydrogenase family protein n=1 Tax=Nocardioides sp. AE5 TaxID=2962573 RepID=UPI00288118C8|nr:acyl-CoA dehydrogenase family protein [Nocardioides sp. AE5]MDT0202489.1 acyl-CoA dehydrogenase family protein [Nocardioides sp. AE5]
METPRSLTGVLDLDLLLTKDELAVRDTVRKLGREKLLPEVSTWFEQGVLPREVADLLGGMGLFGMHLNGYGCAGMSAVEYGLACLELEAIDSGLRSLVSVQGSLAMTAIHKWGSEEQKQQWLPPMARGEVIGCFGLTEPDHGSDPANLRTHARRDGTDWVLNGTKMWITNGGIAGVAVVWAQTEDGIRGFLVPRETPGFSTQDITRKVSLRASVTSELILDDCRLPADAVLEGATGLRGPLSCLDEARYGIVWGAMGAARACFESARDYALSREQFGRPIAGFQLTQKKLADMYLELTKGNLLALQLGRLKDEGRVSAQQVSLGKLNNVREALAIAREARGILGANGITLEYPVMRHANNLESVYTYEGTNEIHTLVVGQALTGLAAFN